MGNQISQVTPSAPTVGIDSYVDELGDIQYDKTCGSARFMKTVKGRHKDGLVIVKIFIKPIANLSLRAFQKQLTIERAALQDVSHAIAYAKIVETERAGYLVRQHFGNILYDRISIRPFLENIEKRWIAFQLLSGLSKCHARGVHHGDIKTENIVVTSWNWVYLTDFACFKPTYLPEDDPADFLFFFDTSLRRVCYVAPERFYAPGENKRGPLTDAMDIFSLGCVIAELFLEGTPTFTLSQLFGYREGSFVPDLSKIDDLEIRSLVRHMISLNPADRLSASGYLEEWSGRAFPTYFYNFLHEYIQNITEPSVLELGERSLAQQYLEADRRIEHIYNDFDKIAFFLKFDAPQLSNGAANSHETTEPIPVYLDIPHYHTSTPVAPRNPPEDGGAVIFLAIVASAIRNTATGRARLHACDLILAFGEQLPDEAKLDRCLPFLVSLLGDDFVDVKVSAMRAITQLMALVQRITPVNENVFPEYILPRLQPLLSSKDVFVRASFASFIATLAQTALRFLDLAQDARIEGISGALVDAELENGIANNDGYQAYFDMLRRELVEQFQDLAITLLTDSDSAVKRALLRSISPLCAFFGSQKASDIILSHLITYLNDKDALLRGAFFDAIIGLATFVGGNSLEEYIMPLMVQALADTEEFVVEKVLFAFTSLAELGLINRPNLWDLVRITVRFSVHPNLWIRQGVFAFISASVRWLSPADIHCIIGPIIKPFLQCDVLEYSEIMLQDFCKPPLPRIIYNAAINWAAETRDSNFWKSAKEQRMSDIMPLFEGSYSITSSLHNLSITKAVAQNAVFSEKLQKTEEDKLWLQKLAVLGLSDDDLWKLVALREHIWRIAKANPNNYKSISTRNDSSSAIDYGSTISVNKLGVQLHTYFFDDTHASVRRHVTKSPISESTIKQYKTASALVDALKTIDQRPSTSLPLKRANFPPYWLNGVEGSPRTMAPIFQLDSPTRPTAASVFMTSPSRVQSNITRINTLESTTSTTNGPLSDNETAPPTSAAGDSVLERQLTLSRELRRRASIATFKSKVDDDHNPLKAVADVGTSNATAYGHVDGSEKEDKSPTSKTNAVAPAKIDKTPPMEMTSMMAAQYPMTEEDAPAETVVYRGHSYTGDDPYILKLLDTVYVEKFMVDIPEFGPTLPLAARPRSLLKHGAGPVPVPGSQWRPDGVLIAHFEEHAGPVNKIAIAPDHSFFLTASDDGTIKVWDSMQLERNVTNRSRQTYKHANGTKVKTLCMIDGTYCFASGSTDGVINIVKVDYSTPAGRGISKYNKLSTLRSYKLEEGEYAIEMQHMKIESVSTLIVATNKSRILGINLRHEKLTLSLAFVNPAHHGTITCFCVDRTRSWIAVGMSRGIIDIWSIRYQVRLKAWGLQAATPIHKITMHPVRGNGKCICVVGGASVTGDEVTVWDVERTICREVFRTTAENGPASTMERKYEPVLVDDEPTETLISRFANDPVQLLERNEASISRGVRAMCILAPELLVDFEQGNFMADYDGTSNGMPGRGSLRYRAAIMGSFMLTAGADKNLRYWSLAKPETSFIVSGPLAEHARPTYMSYAATDQHMHHIIVHTEVRGAVNALDGLRTVEQAPPAPNGTARGTSSNGPTRRNTDLRRTPPEMATQRNTLITSRQQSMMKFHNDAVLDIAVLFKPYGLVISVDRAGDIKVYS